MPTRPDDDPTARPDLPTSLSGALAVAPAQIEQVLADLWAPAAAAVGPEGRPAITRVSLGTLCVFGEAAREAEFDALLERLAVHHPSRAVLVVIDPAAGPAITAQVSAACHLPAPGQPQVCSERIRLRCGPDGYARLPGTLLPLLEPDVPATLWWDLPSLPPSELCHQLGRVLDRSLTDLTRAEDPAGIYRRLVEEGCEPISDLAWFRARSWREAVARGFDSPAHQSVLPAIESLEITCAAASDGQLFPAALLGGWVAGQLGWQPVARQDPPAGAAAAEGELVSWTRWRRPSGGEATVRLATVPLDDGRPGRLQAARLCAPAEHAHWLFERLHERPRELQFEVRHPLWSQVPTYLPAPRPQRLEILEHTFMAPVRTVTRDRSLRHAGWILGWLETANTPAAAPS